MSDFVNVFWSHFVTVIALGGILACALLLWLTARFRGPASADNTTGHVWDEDLREMNNPMPRWWMGLFVLTIVFGIGYLVVFPGLGSYRGTLAWSTQGEYEKAVDKANAELAPVYAAYSAQAVEKLATDAGAMAVASGCSSTTAPSATARMRAAARASRTSPTATGCMAGPPRRSTRPSRSGASERCRRWPRRSDRPRT